jgi:tRNA dimethylallyltransferase
MKIGTAQPVPDKIESNVWYIDGIKHYLYGYRSIKEPLNISLFQKDVQKVLNSADGTPILVGGTGLYIDCVVHNYSISDEDISTDEREKLLELSLEELQKRIDKDVLKSLNNSDRNNPRRLIRIIEGGVKKEKHNPLKHIYFVIDIPKKKLEERISKRVDSMFNAGLEIEVKDLFSKYNSSLPTFNTIGYQEFREYFKKEKSLEDVKKEIILHTKQYAKRQRTWFRRNEDAIWINDMKDILQQAEQFIKIS